MIVVKVELWPLGCEEHKVDLGTCEIELKRVSDGGDVGDYEARLLKGEKYSARPGTLYRKGAVSGFLRRDRRFGPWELLALALEATVGERVERLRRAMATRKEGR